MRAYFVISCGSLLAAGALVLLAARTFRRIAEVAGSHRGAQETHR